MFTVKQLIAAFVVAFLLPIAGYGLWAWTTSMGHKAVVEIAREKGLCTDTECEEGTRLALLTVSESTGMSPAMIEWCVGVDDWAATPVRRGGWMKAILIEGMYLPCGQLSD